MNQYFFYYCFPSPPTCFSHTLTEYLNKDFLFNIVEDTTISDAPSLGIKILHAQSEGFILTLIIRSLMVHCRTWRYTKITALPSDVHSLTHTTTGGATTIPVAKVLWNRSKDPIASGSYFLFKWLLCVPANSQCHLMGSREAIFTINPYSWTHDYNDFVPQFFCNFHPSDNQIPVPVILNSMFSWYCIINMSDINLFQTPSAPVRPS